MSAGIPTGLSISDFCYLMLIELWLSPHSDSGILGSIAAFTGARFDQFSFELGQPSQDSQHEPTSRSGVGPRLRKGFEQTAFVSDCLMHVDDENKNRTLKSSCIHVGRGRFTEHPGEGIR